MEFLGILLIIYSSLGIWLSFVKDVDKKEWAQPLLPMLAPVIKNGQTGLILATFILGVGWGFINVANFQEQLKQEEATNVLNLSTSQKAIAASIPLNEKGLRERPTQRPERGNIR